MVVLMQGEPQPNKSSRIVFCYIDLPINTDHNESLVDEDHQNDAGPEVSSHTLLANPFIEAGKSKVTETNK